MKKLLITLLFLTSCSSPTRAPQPTCYKQPGLLLRCDGYAPLANPSPVTNTAPYDSWATPFGNHKWQ